MVLLLGRDGLVGLVQASHVLDETQKTEDGFTLKSKRYMKNQNFVLYHTLLKAGFVRSIMINNGNDRFQAYHKKCCNKLVAS
jgi:hypothetical protein